LIKREDSDPSKTIKDPDREKVRDPSGLGGEKEREACI
jgi:hypothetical protein